MGMDNVSLGFAWAERKGRREGADETEDRKTVNQTDILRYNFGDPNYGTLKESINGGSHVRYWRQNGSVELPLLFLFFSRPLSLSADLGLPDGDDQHTTKTEPKPIRALGSLPQVMRNRRR